MYVYSDITVLLLSIVWIIQTSDPYHNISADAHFSSGAPVLDIL